MQAILQQIGSLCFSYILKVAAAIEILKYGPKFWRKSFWLLKRHLAMVFLQERLIRLRRAP